MEVNERDEAKRRYLTRSIAEIKYLPGAIYAESAYFALFLAIDARGVADSELREISKALLSQGCCYFCAWGPDCERVHDQFDLERDSPEPGGFCVMTTWHTRNGLREALEFFAYCAWPTDGFAKSKVDWIAASVGNREWDEAIRGGLSMLALSD